MKIDKEKTIEKLGEKDGDEAMDDDDDI